MATTSPAAAAAAAADFATMYSGVISALTTICAIVQRHVADDAQRFAITAPPASGPAFVSRFVKAVRAEAPQAFDQLDEARKLLAGAEERNHPFDAVHYWMGIWQSPEHQSRYRQLCDGSKEFTRGQDTYWWSGRGYVFRFENGCYYPTEHTTECLMELCAAVWCGLLFCGVRADELWSQVLRLSGDRTNGLPSGVCIYKAYGDVYRHSLRELKALGRNYPGYVERENLRVRHVMHNPSLFRIARNDVADDRLDLSPNVFRRSGELYYVLYQMAYMRSGMHFTLVWLTNRTSEQLALADDLKQWVKYAFGREYTPVRGRPVKDGEVFLDDGSAKWAFWSRPATAAGGLPTCVLGLRYGVLAVTPDPCPGEITSAFGGRRIADDMFRSLVLGVRGSAFQMRELIMKPGPRTGHCIDCLEEAFS